MDVRQSSPGPRVTAPGSLPSPQPGCFFQQGTSLFAMSFHLKRQFTALDQGC